MLIEALEIIVPHEENREYFKKVLESGNSDINFFFEEEIYKFGYTDSNRSFLFQDRKDIFEYVFYDLLTEEYLIPIRKIQNKDNLWSSLSILLINYERNDLRNNLNINLYDNKDYVFDIARCSNILEDENTVVYELKIYDDKSIGLATKFDFTRLKELLKLSKLEINELK